MNMQNAIDFCDNEIREWQVQKEILSQVDTTGLNTEFEELFWAHQSQSWPWRKPEVRLEFMQNLIKTYLKEQKRRNG